MILTSVQRMELFTFDSPLQQGYDVKEFLLVYHRDSDILDVL